MFNKQWFTKHQKTLLWFLNTPVIGWYFRWVMRINGWKSDSSGHKIIKIDPNAVFWIDKVISSKVKRNKIIEKVQYKAEFRTHNKFAKRLLYGFYPLWSLLHLWDTAISPLVQPAWNFGFDTLTRYPDANPETDTVDGSVNYDSGETTTWASIRDKTTGSGNVYPSATTGIIYIRRDGANHWVAFTRAYALFKTSALTAAANISAAKCSFVPNTIDTNTDDLGADSLVAGTPTSDTDIVTADFNKAKFGSTKFADDILFTSMSAGSYHNFSLNASGLAAIDKTGITRFGIRIKADQDNAEPGGSGDFRHQHSYRFADYTGDTSDPKLVITYTSFQPRHGFVNHTDPSIV